MSSPSLEETPKSVVPSGNYFHSEKGWYEKFRTESRSICYLSTICNFNIFDRSVIFGWGSLNFSDNPHALQNLSKNNMFPIQVWCRDGGDEKLWSICIGTWVGHAKETCGNTMIYKLVCIKNFKIFYFAFTIFQWKGSTSFTFLLNSFHDRFTPGWSYKIRQSN